MKKLMLPALFISFYQFTYAQEIVGTTETNSIVSSVKDIEVTELLENTKEFSDCRKKNKFEPNDTPPQRDAKLAAAEKCFKEKVGNVKDSKRLLELSEALNLQPYGLVKSNNVKEIQQYLNDKMYESMTGVKRKDQEMQDLKFGKKKHIDQRTFIELYKTQLTKNALFEVSRFCFENFRNNSTATNFAEHWKDFKNENSYQLANLKDDGDPKFGDFKGAADKEAVYKAMFESMKIGSGAGLSIDMLSSFFTFCGSKIGELCEEFKNSSTVTAGLTPTPAGTPASPQTGSSSGATATKGAAACLTKNRLQEIKKAIATTGEVEKQFDQIAANPDHMASLFAGVPIKIYGDGKDPNEESFDNLTNYSSDDFLERNKDAAAEKKAEDCKKNPERSECEDYFMEAETVDKVKHNIEQELTIKREVEIARVKKMKEDNAKDLEKYLEDNGYFALLEKFKKNPDSVDFDKEIGKEFEAKKEALLSEITKKIGSRQLPADQAQADALKKSAGENIVEESQSERARMAQVVLFNNIITSHLQLQRKDSSGNTTGTLRNVNPWKKEEKSLANAKVDEDLFSNLKTTDNDSGTKAVGHDEQLGGIDFIDTILGKGKTP